MPYFLRKIRKARWYAPTWLTEGELPADPLGDLQTKNNGLSLWEVDDEQTNIIEVVVALASTSQNLSNIDYVLLASDELERVQRRVGFDVRKTAGDSPYEDANKWHCDIVQLSASKLVELAAVVFRVGSKERVTEPSVLQYLVEAVSTKKLPLKRLLPDLQAKVKKRLLANGSSAD